MCRTEKREKKLGAGNHYLCIGWSDYEDLFPFVRPEGIFCKYERNEELITEIGCRAKHLRATPFKVNVLMPFDDKEGKNPLYMSKTA